MMLEKQATNTSIDTSHVHLYYDEDLDDQFVPWRWYIFFFLFKLCIHFFKIYFLNYNIGYSYTMALEINLLHFSFSFFRFQCNPSLFHCGLWLRCGCY